MASPFNIDLFARQLLTEALFNDEEYGVFGHVSLIDPDSVRELYLASYDPELATYLIVQAVEWEDLDADEDGVVDYSLAVEGDKLHTFETPEETADKLLELAREHALAPSFMLMFDEDTA